MKAATDSPSTVRPARRALGTVATLALALMALASVVVAVAAVVVAVEVRGQDGQPVADSSSNASILAALQSLAADRGSGATQVPAGEPANADVVEPAPDTGAPAAGAPADAIPAPEAAPVPAAAPAPASAAVPEPAAAPQVPAPTAAQLTAALHSAVDPAGSLAYRQSYVERGAEAGPVLEQIGTRAGAMLQVVRPLVIDPIDFDGANASGRLQVTFAGAPGPETPLRLTFVYLDGMWKLSARSVCDVASFNGFSCPSGYVR